AVEATKPEPAAPETPALASTAPAAKPEPAKPEQSKAGPPPVNLPATPAPSQAATPAPALDKTETAKPATVASLGVSFDQPAGAAVFRRAGWLWLVFDRKA